jgi:hypothetical protein
MQSILVAAMKRVLTGFAVAVMLAGAAVAGPAEDGYAAYESGDYAKAVELYRLAAEQAMRWPRAFSAEVDIH